MQSRCFSVLFSTQTHPLTACTLSGKGSGAQTLEIDTGASSPSLGRFPCIRINTVLLGPVPNWAQPHRVGEREEEECSTSRRVAAAHHSPVRTRLGVAGGESKIRKRGEKGGRALCDSTWPFFPLEYCSCAARESFTTSAWDPPLTSLSV